MLAGFTAPRGRALDVCARRVGCAFLAGERSLTGRFWSQSRCPSNDRSAVRARAQRGKVGNHRGIGEPDAEVKHRRCLPGLTDKVGQNVQVMTSHGSGLLPPAAR
jgi:hypothetical protein